MKSFKEFCKTNKLKEAKQVGVIYHFTTIDAINKLSDSNLMNSLGCEIFTFASKNTHISTTRGYYMSDDPFADINSTSHPIRIAFDGDKLSDKYKIKPVNGLKTNDPEVFGVNKNHNRVKHKLETEEVICPFKDKIFPLKEYILEIQINEYTLDHKLVKELVTNLKHVLPNVNINTVRKWKPFKKNIPENYIAGCNGEINLVYFIEE